jgi:CheY-like chemotaxis protein
MPFSFHCSSTFDDVLADPMDDQPPGRSLVYVRQPDRSELLGLAWEAAILDRARAVSQSIMARLRELLGDEPVARFGAGGAKPAAPVGKPGSHPAAGGGRRLHVLVVEDRREVRESWCMLLGLWGHAVTSARDGPDAVAAAAAFPPDVVLMDLGLPTIDGYEAARRIRAISGGAGPRFLALTGRGTEPDLERSRCEGFASHLRKPVEASELCELLAQIAREMSAPPACPTP